ncbi:MAG: methyl-accepting chemotaxis protein [Thermodesulfobacteriota bacterium]
MGSYLFLLVLFIAQIPVIYLLVGGMSEKYIQEDVAGSLRKRAGEITEILNRHIITGDQRLKKTFDDRKAEFGAVIESLRKGAGDLPAITDADLLAQLDAVDGKWKAMGSQFDNAMEAGDSLRVHMAEVEDSTFPMVAKLNVMIGSIEGLKDPAYVKFINASGFLRMLTVKMSYFLERYLVTYDKVELVGRSLGDTVAAFEKNLGGIKAGVSGAFGAGAKGKALAAAIEDVERMWDARKAQISKTVAARDAYRVQMEHLINESTPGIIKSADGLTKMFITKAKGSAVNGIIIMAVSALVSAVIAAFFLWSTGSQVIKPIMRIKETVEDFARGDLTRRAGIRVRILGRELDDEVVGLGRSVDEMAEQMSGVIGRITDSSNQLAAASVQLSASSTEISEGADRQSGQTAQVATAMEEMNATVVEVARNSQQASESARNAQSIASNGGEVVSQTLSAMEDVAESTSVTAETIQKLGKSSEEIGTIVSVINDIADQTNLLALNAAIEAARAGEQGRGFAVVADEVRRLAERTTKATKEISGMINAIQEETGKAVDAMGDGAVKVENGVKLANDTGEALGQIVAGVEGVTDMIRQIATASEEQSATTDEITQSMDSIAGVAKASVSAISEVSREAEDMARLATELKELVSGFRIAAAERTAPELKLVEDKGHRAGRAAA